MGEERESNSKLLSLTAERESLDGMAQSILQNKKGGRKPAAGME